MRIDDLFEKTQSEQFSEKLHKRLTDVLMMFKTKNIETTHINNVINELSGMGFSVSKNDLKNEIVDMDEFEIDDNDYITVIDDDQAVQTEPETTEDFDNEELGDDSGYDRIENIAKNAVDDELK